jgi:D-galactose 1-dehydrogenase
VIVKKAGLAFPANRQTPIAADLDMATETGAAIKGEFDWRQTGPQTWDIELETDGGSAVLSLGGAKLTVDGKVTSEGPDVEYPGLYRAFARLIRSGQSDLDAEPLRVVADAFLLGARNEVEPFSF